MSLFTSIFGYLSSFAFLLVILFLVMLQKILWNRPVLDPFIKLICRAIPICFGIRVRVTGQGHLNVSDPCIYMANHVNIFDPILLYGFIPCHVRAVELEDHFSWPIWGTIIKHGGMIPISHSHVSRALKSLHAVEKVLHAGVSVIVMPEGHRTRDGGLGRFMRGPFVLALNARVPIVPVALNGLYERKRVHTPRVHPGKVELAIGTPIASDTMDCESDRTLRDRIRTHMEQLLHRSSGIERIGND